mmetsp:Transcript_39063/g.107640  ORF Transcript_39063/g.107640 Transcript_39063/m.107640 type:complete len:208 (+) Transcript_39063:1469-2092(+)
MVLEESKERAERGAWPGRRSARALIFVLGLVPQLLEDLQHGSAIGPPSPAPSSEEHRELRPSQATREEQRGGGRRQVRSSAPDHLLRLRGSKGLQKRLTEPGAAPRGASWPVGAQCVRVAEQHLAQQHRGQRASVCINGRRGELCRQHGGEAMHVGTLPALQQLGGASPHIRFRREETIERCISIDIHGRPRTRAQEAWLEERAEST